MTEGRPVSGRGDRPGAPCETSSGRSEGLGRARRLLPFACLYVSFGLTFGFLSAGAPLILRYRGIELAQVGLLQVINVPLGLTFVWAGAVDRWRLPGWPHRLGWIALAQAVAVAGLMVLSISEQAHALTLLAIALTITVCVATMDISLEALIVETVTSDERPYVSSAKFCAVSVGGILGAGVIVASYERLGWLGSVLIVAILDAVCALPMLFYPERQLRRSDALVERHRGRLARLRFLARHIVVLGVYFAALHAVSGLNGLALIDLGLPLASAAVVSGTVSPIINLGMALSSASLLRRYGTVRVTTVFACGIIVATAVMVVATANGSPRLGVAATLGCYVCSSGLGVPVFNMLYRWAEGPRAATDYALLFGAAFFASMPVRIGGPAVASGIGWSSYFALAILLYAGAFYMLRRAISEGAGSEGRHHDT